MASQTSPAQPADARQATEPFTSIVEACAHLLNANHRLTELLHTAGLITDQTASALLASEDQIDAAITDLRTHRNNPTG